MANLKERWKNVCECYLDEFCYKHEFPYEADMWVGGDVGTLATIGDMIVSMDDIRYDIDNLIDYRCFEKWYWKNQDVRELTNGTYMNYPSYCKGAPDIWTKERLDAIRKMRTKISEDKEKLEKMINDFKAESVEESSDTSLSPVVDLGLSVKWMKYNVDVNPNYLDNAADWYGGYYAWGELGYNKLNDKYTWENYKYGNPNKLSKYNSRDGKTVLDSEDDVVTAAYGPNFRMPTANEFKELMSLQNEFVTYYQGIIGLNGRLFHGRGDYSDNTLFIPSAGICDEDGRNGVGDECYMWSSELHTKTNYAYNLHIIESYEITGYHRCTGQTVRGVKNK